MSALGHEASVGVVAWPHVEAQRPVFTIGTPGEVAQARDRADHVRARAAQGHRWPE